VARYRVGLDDVDLAKALRDWVYRRYAYSRTVDGYNEGAFPVVYAEEVVEDLILSNDSLGDAYLLAAGTRSRLVQELKRLVGMVPSSEREGIEQEIARVGDEIDRLKRGMEKARHREAGLFAMRAKLHEDPPGRLPRLDDED
jgi:hypothetical protein